MIKQRFTFLVLLNLVYIISGCNLIKFNPSPKTGEQIVNPKVEVRETTIKTVPSFKATETRIIDLVHMKLAVQFNYEKQHVIGQAFLFIKPYFYELNSFELDAKGFDIKRVALISNQTDTLLLKYEYNKEKLKITLDKTYNKSQTFQVFIDYVAKPNEIITEGGNAIQDDRGLYFINPLGKEEGKPRQIWTQGETQSNSCWFPTVDIPNEKITQEIAITVDDKDITLSNGELMMSKINSDGKRTDYWKQTKPHAPYLVMLAVGEFAQVKDFWRDSIPVDYYVEPAYKPYAKMIFGNTPEMLEVFSRKLGVDYPWDKYSQIVVRDFVSGAMENTSAVIHFDRVQHDAREHLDQPYEDIIAHELFHHWFGDLVTCESWSNLPLNESFATYGEYIWNEHKYGQLFADHEFNRNLFAYLASKNKHKVEPIRYHYHNRDEMFDVVSYQKGSLILHQLRKMIGDEAFFSALKLFLTRHAFNTAEIANLRMAFEEITGQDLQWYFNQWFLKAGHPELFVNYSYGENKNEVTVEVTQLQDSNYVYQLPILIDVYGAGGKTSTSVNINKSKQTITIKHTSPISFVVFDADKRLLAKINETQSHEAYANMLFEAPLYRDKLLALNGFCEDLPDSFSAKDLQTIQFLLRHKEWPIRELGLLAFESIDSLNTQLFLTDLNKIANSDYKASNRALAIKALQEYNAIQFSNVFEQKLNDSAYSVVKASIQALGAVNPQYAIEKTKSLRTIKNGGVQLAIVKLIVTASNNDENEYFSTILGKYGFTNYAIIAEFGRYIMKSNKAIQFKGAKVFASYFPKADKYSKVVLTQQVKLLVQDLNNKKENLIAPFKQQNNQTQLPEQVSAEVKVIDELIAAFKNSVQ